MPNVVLVTGVSRFMGTQLAGELSADSSIERVIGIDSIQPRRADLARLGRTEFVRADVRNPLIAKVISQARVDTVVHTPLRSVGGASRPGIAKEIALVGTMQLLSACQKSETVNHVVVRSTTAVYGAGPRDPAVFTEDMHAVGYAPGGYAKDAVEVEGYVRGFIRRRPDVPVTILRLASLIGPTIDSAMSRYLAMPIVPSSLGFDPRLQLLHEDDGVEALRRAVVEDHPGVFNVAGAGMITLSQAVRRAGRLRLPVPAPALALAGNVVRNSGALELSAEQASFLNFGRVVDTSRLRTVFGFEPQYSTAQALDSYLLGQAMLPRLSTAALQIASGLAGSIARRMTPTPAPGG